LLEAMGKQSMSGLPIVRSLAGKYKDCTFSTQRLLEERQCDWERENAK